MTPLRRRRWWLVIVLTTVAVFGAACSSTPSAAPVKNIVDKGTPFGDLLVPKLTASVTDGAVGVTVDPPVTCPSDGVLGAVTMVNDKGKASRASSARTACTWPTSEPLGYNKRYTLNAQALGLGGVATAPDDLRDAVRPRT